VTHPYRVRQSAAAAFAVLLALWTWKLLEPSPVPESLLGGLHSWDELLPFLLAKTLHCCGYALLAALALVWPPAKWKPAVVGGLMAHSAATEFLQYVLPFNRTGRVADVLIDWVGIALGVVAYRLTVRALRKADKPAR
jgi:hypothetical protein